MTQGRRGRVRQGNAPKKTGGTHSIPKPRNPHTLRHRMPSAHFSWGGERHPPGAGNLPYPPLAHLPVAVFNEVTQTFGPCVKNRLTEADGAGSGGATLGIMLLGTRAQGLLPHYER